MKPNDRAIEAARAAILKAIAERNCIIAGVPFNETNYDEFDAGEAVEHSRVALDAAYAAQFQSGDYAGLVDRLRSQNELYVEKCVGTHDVDENKIEPLCNEAADAIEAVLAERDALNFELAARKEWPQARAEMLEELAKVRAERDALLARLAPVEDEELVEIVAKVLQGGDELEWSVLPEEWKKHWRESARAAIAAIHPHIEAAEREKWQKMLARMGAGTTKTGAVNE